MSTTPNVPPGWFPDPHDTAQLRWWDGTAWTAHTHRDAAPAIAAVAKKEPRTDTPRKRAGQIAELSDEEYEAGLGERIDKIVAALSEGDVETAGGLEHHLIAYATGRRGKKALPDAIARLNSARSAADIRLGALIAVIKGEGFLGRTGRGGSFLPQSTASSASIGIFEDRVIQGGSTRRIDEYTQAQIFVDGQKFVHTRPSLTAMALASSLPGSSLGIGMAMGRKETRDERVAEFQVTGPDWSMSVAISPQNATSYRTVAARVNAIADRFAQQKMTEAASAGKPIATDVVGQIERIVQLHSSGAITAEQSEALKTQVIAQS